MTTSPFPQQRGLPLPLGTSTKESGSVNFALFSKHATAITLSLFHPKEREPFFEVSLDPVLNKTGEIWHILLSGLPKEIEYGFRLEGPYAPEKGLFFNSAHLLLDPYATSLNLPEQWDEKQALPLRGRVIPGSDFDWEMDTHPQILIRDLIIYEMHVRAFTQDPSSRSPHKGTFLGIIEKIPYLKKLGVNAIELLPIFEFNECDYQKINPKTKKPLCNFWGYSTLNFFSPMRRYAFSAEWGGAINEFKQMVKALHKQGIEIFLDVVFNHTAEGGPQGPTTSFRGIDNPVYYLVDEKGHYRDFSGCGNTLNCNHPVVAHFILDSLRYWVSEMHVDGFRFDLASVFSRDEHGNVLSDPPLIKAMSTDPLLANVKFIAEAWDAAGLYQVGSFPHQYRWAEWNGKYRDVVRDFIKGTPGCKKEFARAFCGSDDLYGKTGNPYHSINFITAHDGFTLRDLVSFQQKHNEDNGEENRDGCNDNRSWNCGEEGETTDPAIQALRQKQLRNLHLTLMLSLGTPMILMGDEYGHTRLGNNNAWCQDNELNWFLWDQLEKEGDFFRFYSLALSFRQKHSMLHPKHFFHPKDVDWHGVIPLHPEWDQDNGFIALTLKDPERKKELYIAFNANHRVSPVQLPHPPKNSYWHRCVDTALPSPEDFLEHPEKAPPLSETYTMQPYSILLALSP
jgi:isoamylase